VKSSFRRKSQSTETGNGTVGFVCDVHVTILKAPRTDEKWVEWLESKIALLVNRDGVDPRDYSGKSYDE
jgi:hypothetical protein